MSDVRRTYYVPATTTTATTGPPTAIVVAAASPAVCCAYYELLYDVLRTCTTWYYVLGTHAAQNANVQQRQRTTSAATLPLLLLTLLLLASFSAPRANVKMGAVSPPDRSLSQASRPKPAGSGRRLSKPRTARRDSGAGARCWPAGTLVFVVRSARRCGIGCRFASVVVSVVGVANGNPDNLRDNGGNTTTKTTTQNTTTTTSSPTSAAKSHAVRKPRLAWLRRQRRLGPDATNTGRDRNVANANATAAVSTVDAATASIATNPPTTTTQRRRQRQRLLRGFNGKRMQLRQRLLRRRLPQGICQCPRLRRIYVGQTRPREKPIYARLVLQIGVHLERVYPLLRPTLRIHAPNCQRMRTQ